MNRKWQIYAQKLNSIILPGCLIPFSLPVLLKILWFTHPGSLQVGTKVVTIAMHHLLTHAALFNLKALDTAINVGLPQRDYNIKFQEIM